MKDTLLVKAKDKGYTITRTLTENITNKELQSRIKNVNKDIETYEDATDNLILNREKLVAEYREKIDKNIVDYKKEIKKLYANLKALEDAVGFGQGKASSTVEGNTRDGAE